MTTIVVACVEFGWGSAGKLRLILDEVLTRAPATELVLIGSELGACLLEHLPIRRTYPKAAAIDVGDIVRREQADAALVVLDPEVAEAAHDAGCPTVYVDSLPFLWTPADPVPHKVEAYCAQQCPALPQAAVDALGPVQNLRWVQAIVPPPASPRPRSSTLAVVNFGGLSAPGHNAAAQYVDLLLAPVVEALECCGFRTIEVCGNLPSDSYETLRGTTVHVGQHSPNRFDELVRTAGMLVTSPGLTTLLAASAAGTPTICMPPQNLSQVDNASRHADCTFSAAIVPWPVDVMQPGELARLRVKGEAQAIEYIYAGIRGCAANPGSIQQQLKRQIKIAIGHASRHRDWSRMADLIGQQGAAEVASIVLAAAGEPTAATPVGAASSPRPRTTNFTERATPHAYESSLKRGLAETLLVPDAVLGVSGSAVLLAALCTLGPSGGQVIMPAWSCQSVISAALLAGMVPAMADVDESFGMVLPDQPEPGSIVLYAPYGGNIHDLQRVHDWCQARSVEMVLDFAQVADQSVWHVRPRGAFCLSSFGASKPLAGAGGGLLTGPADLLRLAQDFLRGGVTEGGEKTGLGMALGMQTGQFRAASEGVATLGESQVMWRAQACSLLADAEGLFSGWADCALALSRIPRTDRRALRPAHPESTYMSPGWRRALSSRHHICDAAHQAKFYQDLYPHLSVQKPDLAGASRCQLGAPS